MAFVIADRIKETSTTTGTGTLTLAGAVAGFRSFASVGNANTTTYLIVAVDANGVPTGEWETGIGTYTSSGTTLARTSLIASSTGSAVSFAAGTKHVICTDVAKYTTPLVTSSTSTRSIQVADQTAISSTAGDARGTGAVDLQIKRNNSAKVGSGNYSFQAGKYNTSSGTGAVSLGIYNTASGVTCASALGGYRNTVSGSFGAAIGCMALSDKHGQFTHSSGYITAVGDAQTSELLVRKQTTNNTQAECFLDNSSARLTIASDTTWGFDALIVARRTNADNESAFWRIVGCIDNNAGTVALVGSITITTIADDSSAVWAVTAVADDTNDALVFKVTGANSKTINWCGRIRLVEVTG